MRNKESNKIHSADITIDVSSDHNQGDSFNAEEIIDWQDIARPSFIPKRVAPKKNKKAANKTTAVNHNQQNSFIMGNDESTYSYDTSHKQHHAHPLLADMPQQNSGNNDFDVISDNLPLLEESVSTAENDIDKPIPIHTSRHLTKEIEDVLLSHRVDLCDSKRHVLVNSIVKIINKYYR